MGKGAQIITDDVSIVISNLGESIEFFALLPPGLPLEKAFAVGVSQERAESFWDLSLHCYHAFWCVNSKEDQGSA
jgi:hypothetical protein